jgi:hypothetical protein
VPEAAAGATPPGAGFHHCLCRRVARRRSTLFTRRHARSAAVDNGAPGLRPDYGEYYYATFMVDPDGHRIEAVIKSVA